ncbi:MFS general substrate transporter [Heliocybe sulcata]|uniref:MFS general substrate transporter n=1 Tax=Heliocybe sulcata TaxID=5364 RepID=A0A5C3NA80_9AGAM|nr:MFS general substrate transporter [Heliocybe sulcata]
MDSSSERSEKHAAMAVDVGEADVAAQLTAGKDVTLDPQQALRLRRKIDLHLMPLMCILYLMQFADKTTLGQSAVLGIIPGAHLNQNQFNWLGTIFYLSYLVFEWPQNLALQRFPVGKWMSINIFIWAIALLSHAACTSFGGLFACRFIMGMAEGAITPGFMIVTSMFYTRKEQTQRTGYWFLMNGVAVIILGFIAFGVLHTKTHNFMPWQWLMIITGVITLVVAVLFWFFFPDSPATARFLSAEERVLAIERIKVNQAGVENKRFKKEQLIEAFKDPKTYLFFFFAGISQVINSLTNQRQLIVNEFGFTTIQTTLLGCVDGVVEIVTIYIAVTLATYIPNGRAYAGALMAVPAILGCILVNTLPSHNRIGLLFSYWVSIFAIPPFVIFLAWVGQITAGHTKRTTTNAIVLIGYALGNAAGPFMWKKQYQPRNHIPWAVMTACIFVYTILLLCIRAYCVYENKRRDREQRDDNYDDVFVMVKNEDGTVIEKKVDKAFLDLTDRENRDFRYVL